MFRILVTAAVLCGSGHPSLDGYRPVALDRPLRELHRDINRAAAEGRRALKFFDDARTVRHFTGALNQLNAMWRTM